VSQPDAILATITPTKPTRSTPMMTSTTSTPALDQLRPQEQAGLLPALLAAHPEMAEPLEALALAWIRDVDADLIARDLMSRLHELPLDALAARGGRQPGTYVHETDAANELVAEVIAPYEQDLWRAAGLYLPDVAQTILLGIVAGLARCCDAPDGSVLAYAGPDTPLEHAAWLTRKALEARIVLDRDEVESRCPDWTLLPDGLRWT
jgi:hypothetical protein